MNIDLSSMTGGLKGLGEESIRRHRLGPAMFLSGIDTELFRKDYAQAVVAGERALREGIVLCRELENRGVPCIAYRGPFAGAVLYGDVGARPFTDVDLIVPRALRNAALRVAERIGFERCDPLKPRWFDARHHFHWAIRKESPALLCDLHWAVHNPYRLVRIDYDSIFRESVWIDVGGVNIRTPRPEHLLLMYFAQLGREDGAQWLKWLDVALLVKRCGPEMNWNAVFETAAAWRIESDVAAGLVHVARAFPVDLTGPVTAWAREKSAAAAARMAPSVPGNVNGLPLPAYLWNVFRRFGVPYLFPDASYFGPCHPIGLFAKRAAHFLAGSVRLLFGALDLAACRAVVGVKRLLLILALSAVMLPGASAGDDYGNSPAQAFAVPDTNMQASGVIETDTDQDWFRFHAMPFATYTLAVSTGTVWDSTIELWDPNGTLRIRMTNTAWSGSPAQIVWTNPGAMSAFYIRVGGLVEFTTGSYHLAVTASGYTDSDNDGMPDEWELEHLGSLTNEPGGDFDGDSFNNLNEFYLATLPESFASRLHVTSIAPTTTSARVTWAASLYGNYQVWVSTNLENGAGWVLRTNRISEVTGDEEFLDVGALSSGPRFYRVGFSW